MTEIARQLINDLRHALAGLGDAPQDMTDVIERQHGPSISMALDELLAVSYQIVEADEQALIFSPAAQPNSG